MSMTIDEAKRCIKDVVFVALPDVADWMRTTSPQPNETLELWAKALMRLELEEVKRVIDLWFTGSVEPPKNYERQLVPQCIINNAMRLRSDAASRIAVLKRRDENTKQSGSIMRAVEGLPIHVEQWVPRHAMVKSGEMTEKQATQEYNAILDAAFAAGRVRFTL